MGAPTAPEADFPDLTRLLSPRSVAVIGASDRPGSLGGETVRLLRKFNFPGPVWPINPEAAPVADLSGFATVADLPEIPDVVIFAVSADIVVKLLPECIARGIGAGIAYAGGFAEAGTAGQALQDKVAALCHDAGFALCGPNCLGIINTGAGATLTFSTTLYEAQTLRAGAISMVSQSGGIATVAMSMAAGMGFGFRTLISGGNEAVLGFADYIYALADDDGTRVIAGYLEGVADGSRLVHALEHARRRGKPVVIIKSGTTAVSARAAQAHTGALAGEDRVVDAVLRELGVIRVGGMEELVDVCLTLTSISRPIGPGVGIISFGGGFGVLATDQCVQAGLTVPALRPTCVDRLRPLLVSVASSANPLDLTPTTAFRADALARLPQAMDVVAAEPDIHALLFIVGGLAARASEIRDLILHFFRRTAKPVIVSWPSPPTGVIEDLAGYGVPVFIDPARGIHALALLVQTVEPAFEPLNIPDFSLVDWEAVMPDAASTFVLPEDRCHILLAQAGLPVAAARMARSEQDARSATAWTGLPVVLKAISPAVTHRAAAGLLAMDLRSEEEVGGAYRHLVDRAAAQAVSLDGIYVQKIHAGGIELLVSAIRDPVFGTMIACGHGGNMTEVIDDMVLHRAPVGIAAATHMLRRLRLGRHALRTNLDLASAATFIARFSQLAAAAPFKRFTFEVNPIKWAADGVIAVDGLLIVEER